MHPGIHDPVIRTCFFRFYEELNDFLPGPVRRKSFPVQFTGTPSVKNTIEAIGVPHAEIDLILIDGISVGFEQLISGGEHISVYPVFESLDISPVIRLRAKPLRHTRFIVDVNLGKLAKKLRLLGFDTLYRNDYRDGEIVAEAAARHRIILTRDTGLLKHTAVTHGYWLRSDDPVQQVKEVVQRFQLQTCMDPFSRCSRCNGTLVSATPAEAKNRVPAETFQTFQQFWKCNSCGNLYWEGSHFSRITLWIKEL